jgi:hypothetical protein
MSEPDKSAVAELHAAMRGNQQGSILETAKVWRRQRFTLKTFEREGFHFLKLIARGGQHMATFALTPEETEQLRRRTRPNDCTPDILAPLRRGSFWK